MSLQPGIIGAVDVSQGLPREKINVPICPVSEPTDDILFEDPRDPGKKMYLPRYRIKTKGGQYEIGIKCGQDSVWRLIIGLERFPAPELGFSVNGLEMLRHDIEASLLYNTGPFNTREETIIFNEIAFDDDDNGGVTISADLNYERRDELLVALQTQDANTRLVIYRTINVAVEIESQGKAPKSIKPAKQFMTFGSRINLPPPDPVELRLFQRITR